MPSGFETYDVNGRLQCNQDLLLFFLRKSGTVSAEFGGYPLDTNRLRVPGVSSYPEALVGFSGGGGYGVGYELNGGGSWSYITDAPVGQSFNYFIFEASDKIPTSNFGIEVYNSAGKLTFATSQRAMRVKQILNMPDDNTVSATFSGRQLGFIPMHWGGYNRYGPSDTGEPGYYFHDWSVYAGAVINSGQTIQTRIVNVPGGRRDVAGTEPTDNAFERGGQFFVIDVTNWPVGQTFY